MTASWDDILLAFLHDPPDQALAVSSEEQVPSHESRRLELAKALVGGDEVSQTKIKKITAAVDVVASKVERLPMPKGQHVNVEKGRLSITHPLGAGASGGSVRLLKRWTTPPCPETPQGSRQRRIAHHEPESQRSHSRLRGRRPGRPETFLIRCTRNSARSCVRIAPTSMRS